MSATLKDIVFQVRMWLGEPEEFAWQDYQIVVAANSALQEMVSAAGGLTKEQDILLQPTNLPNPQNPGQTQTAIQEAALDMEVDRVKSVKYFSGQLFDLEYSEWKILQTGASTGSIPKYYYLKTSTRELTPQLTSTSNIYNIPIGPGMPGGEVYRTVIGCWPVPPQPATLKVFYSYFHPFVQDPSDPVEVPRQFIKGVQAAATAYCLRTEKAVAEAQEYEAMFDKYKEQYRVYMGSQRQSDNPARYGPRMQPWRQSASSSVVLVDPFPHM